MGRLDREPRTVGRVDDPRRFRGTPLQQGATLLDRRGTLTPRPACADRRSVPNSPPRRAPRTKPATWIQLFTAFGGE